MSRGMPIHRWIVQHLGEGVLEASGEIDFSQLHGAAKSNRSFRDAYQAAVRGILQDSLQQKIEEAPTGPIFVRARSADAYGIRPMCSAVWAVTTPTQDPRDRSGDRARGARTAMWGERAAHDLLIVDTGVPNDLREQISHGLRALGVGPRPISAEAPALKGTAPAVAVEATQPARAVKPVARAQVAATEPATPPPVAESEPRVMMTVGSLELRVAAQRLVGGLLILLGIAFLSTWGLVLAQYGREHIAVMPLQALWEAIRTTGQYVLAHPATYYWARDQQPWASLVGSTLLNSAVLLLLSLVTALVLGYPLGVAAAISQRRGISGLVVVISVLGASVPSFLFGMILWAVNIWVHNAFQIRVLPATGFGWDGHVIMPMLVLAMRPLAQVAQITYVSLKEALGQDYVRTAISKGLRWQTVLRRHLVPNVLIPILTTLGSSLRFSLASLPVIEVFFHWPGVGLMLLDAIDAGNIPLAVDLIVSLGLFFVIVNAVLELVFPIIDPRLRRPPEWQRDLDRRGGSARALDWLRDTWEAWRETLGRLRPQKRVTTLPPLPATAKTATSEESVGQQGKRRRRWRTLVGNPALLLGAGMLLVLAGIAVAGNKLTSANPYQTHGIMSVEGVYASPPFKPSTQFPWGTDHIGRDIQALVLDGASRTLGLALFATLARLLLGVALGILAGWRRGAWLDRMVTGAVGIWAAFPATLFAMIVIQALGIQQGMWVFVVALSIVGWGEIAQFVRGQVIALKPQPFIESARSVGAGDGAILRRHVLPNLANSLTVIAALEMGGVLMLLAELGFLNIFMGGGFRSMIAEAGNMTPIVAFYSDVPEWSALIANVREYWRSYPWMALYPGMAFVLAILAFNVFGEGLRRFLDDGAISIGRLFNRKTALAGVAVLISFSLVLSSSTPIHLYRGEANRFDEGGVVRDIQVLADPRLGGRETGTPGADLAALYIAQRMQQIGLTPGGEHNTYLQRLLQPRMHLTGVPSLALDNTSGAAPLQFRYRTDFVEIAQSPQDIGQAHETLMGAAFGPPLDDTGNNSAYHLGNSEAVDHIVIVTAEDAAKVTRQHVRGLLVIADRPEDLAKRDVYPYLLARTEFRRPYLLISPAVGDALLRTAGSSLQEFTSLRSSLKPGDLALTKEGASVSINIPASDELNLRDEAYVNVIGVIPGEGHFMGTDNQVILVSAYYDGVGTDPEGQVFPGANDNASGVGMMLQLAQLLKSSAYPPDKTVMFVAWAGGQRQEGLSTVNILNARPGAGSLTVETIMELSGVGAGTGSSIAIGNDSSFRLVQLFQEAAGAYRTPTTTRGRGPHYGVQVSSVFGGRKATTLSLSWDGSDQTAHTAADSVDSIDPNKIRQIGRAAYLTLLVLSRDTNY
jgi:peptide/nickel transport system permease protein